jgi:hypothetical protein
MLTTMAVLGGGALVGPLTTYAGLKAVKKTGKDVTRSALVICEKRYPKLNVTLLDRCPMRPKNNCTY